MVSLSMTSASYSSMAKTATGRNSFTFAAVAGTSSNRRLVALGKDGISKNGFGVLGYDTTSGVGGELKRYMGLQYSDDGYDLVEMKGNLDLISFTHALTPVTGSWTTAYREAPSPQLLIYMLVHPQPYSTSHEGVYGSLTIYPCAQRLPVLPNQSTSVVVESDNHPILSLNLLGRSYHYSMPYIPSPDFICRCRPHGSS